MNPNAHSKEEEDDRLHHAVICSIVGEPQEASQEARLQEKSKKYNYY